MSSPTSIQPSQPATPETTANHVYRKHVSIGGRRKSTNDVSPPPSTNIREGFRRAATPGPEMPPPANMNNAIEAARLMEDWGKMSMENLIAQLSRSGPLPSFPLYWAVGKRGHGEEPMTPGVLCDVELIEGAFEKRAQAGITAPMNVYAKGRPNFYKMLWTIMILHKDSPVSKRRKVETRETALAKNVDSSQPATILPFPVIQPVSHVVSWLHKAAFDDTIKDKENLLDRTEELLPHYPFPTTIRLALSTVAREVNTAFFVRYMGSLAPFKLHRDLDGQVAFVRWWAATAPENLIHFKKTWVKGDDLSKSLREELKMALGLKDDSQLSSALSTGLEDISRLRRRIMSVVLGEFNRLLLEEVEKIEENNKKKVPLRGNGWTSSSQQVARRFPENDNTLRRKILSKGAYSLYEEEDVDDWDEVY
ncbi:hypothetical protein CPB86DRAFT_556175 [Serendipita vermifera]|nr:hypothetical protein CPB86DRAFT_556175 [Serendipita vermifera]